MNTHKEIFEAWIGGQLSPQTQRSYRQKCNKFFNMVFGKDAYLATKEEIESITPALVTSKFLEVERKNGMKLGTTKQTLKAVTLYIKELRANRVYGDINYDYIIDKALIMKGRKDSDREFTNPMNFDMMNRMVDWLKHERFKNAKSPYKSKGVQYATLVKFMWQTATRVSASLNLEWSDFKYEPDVNGQLGWVLYANDKGGKTNKKFVSEALFRMIKSNFYHLGTNKVFSACSKDGFSDLFNEFSNLVNYKVTPHSIKAGAISHLYQLTNDPQQVMKFADHEDFNTTLGYMKRNYDRESSGEYMMAQSVKADESRLAELTKEQLLELIYNHKLGNKLATHAMNDGYLGNAVVTGTDNNVVFLDRVC